MQISLVIPLRNEESSVSQLLASIRGQSRRPDEVVIVDAGSTDRTAEVLRSIPQEGQMQVLSRGPLYPGDARNEGVAAARYDWIAFTDGGIRLDPDWLATLSQTAITTGADVVLGNYHPVCDTRFKQAAAIAYVPPLRPSGLRGPFVASMLVRRDALLATGGFPSFRAAEDLILLDKLLQVPRQVAEAPGAGIHWQIPGSFAAVFRRFALYSYHNLLAGRAYDWHWGVARQYGVVAVAAAGSAFLSGWLAALVWPSFFLVRAGKAAWVKRRSFTFPTLGPQRILLTAMILAVIDGATLAGVLRWLLDSPPHN